MDRRMRRVFITILSLPLLAVGCGDEKKCSDTCSECSDTCSGCTRTFCLVSPTEFNAICTDVCTNDLDCQSGEKCMEILSTHVATGRHCLGSNVGSSCGGLICLTSYIVGCADASTFATSDAVGDLCGVSYTYCPNGCDLGSGSVLPHCR
jgi:hypothetical protein